MNIVIMGLPGAGKGTHAQRLEFELGMVHLSSGNIIKQAIAEESSLGQQAKQYVYRGELVPDEIVNKLMNSNIRTHRGDDLLFDGYPRTLVQAKELEQILNKQDRKIDLCLFLQVDDKDLLNRISGRRICSTDGSVYHVTFDPPRKEGFCDKCGKPLLQREDDKKEIVKKRIVDSKNRIFKIIDFYEKKGVLEKVAGTERSPDEVHHDVRSVVKDYIKNS